MRAAYFSLMGTVAGDVPAAGDYHRGALVGGGWISDHGAGLAGTSEM